MEVEVIMKTNLKTLVVLITPTTVTLTTPVTSAKATQTTTATTTATTLERAAMLKREKKIIQQVKGAVIKLPQAKGMGNEDKMRVTQMILNFLKFNLILRAKKFIVCTMICLATT
jgi:hypothetical protein